MYSRLLDGVLHDEPDAQLHERRVQVMRSLVDEMRTNPTRREQNRDLFGSLITDAMDERIDGRREY